MDRLPTGALQVELKGGCELAYFDKYLALVWKQYKIWPSYNWRRRRIRMRSTDLGHFHWHWTTPAKISMPRQFLTLNMSLTTQGRHIFRPTIDDYQKLTYTLYSLL